MEAIWKAKTFSVHVRHFSTPLKWMDSHIGILGSVLEAQSCGKSSLHSQPGAGFTSLVFVMWKVQQNASFSRKLRNHTFVGGCKHRAKHLCLWNVSMLQWKFQVKQKNYMKLSCTLKHTFGVCGLRRDQWRPLLQKLTGYFWETQRSHLVESIWSGSKHFVFTWGTSSSSSRRWWAAVERNSRGVFGDRPGSGNDSNTDKLADMFGHTLVFKKRINKTRLAVWYQDY